MTPTASSPRTPPCSVRPGQQRPRRPWQPGRLLVAGMALVMVAALVPRAVAEDTIGSDLPPPPPEVAADLSLEQPPLVAPGDAGERNDAGDPEAGTLPQRWTLHLVHVPTRNWSDPAAEGTDIAGVVPVQRDQDPGSTPAANDPRGQTAQDQAAAGSEQAEADPLTQVAQAQPLDAGQACGAGGGCTSGPGILDGLAAAVAAAGGSGAPSPLEGHPSGKATRQPPDPRVSPPALVWTPPPAQAASSLQSGTGSPARGVLAAAAATGHGAPAVLASPARTGFAGSLTGRVLQALSNAVTPASAQAMVTAAAAHQAPGPGNSAPLATAAAPVYASSSSVIDEPRLMAIIAGAAGAGLGFAFAAASLAFIGMVPGFALSVYALTYQLLAFSQNLPPSPEDVATISRETSLPLAVGTGLLTSSVLLGGIWVALAVRGGALAALATAYPLVGLAVLVAGLVALVGGAVAGWYSWRTNRALLGGGQRGADEQMPQKPSRPSSE